MECGIWGNEMWVTIAEGIAGCIVAYFGMVVLHEIGHAAACRLAGGRVYMICLGRATWIRNVGWMLWRGASGREPGRCLLVCEEKRALYAAVAGGCVANGLTGIAAMLWIWHCREAGRWSMGMGILLYFAVFSLFAAMLNWFWNGEREETDGAVYRKLRKEEEGFVEYKKAQELCLFLLEYGLLQEVMEG